MSYNEIKQRGTYDLPMELYTIDCNHPKYEMVHHWHSEFEIIRIIDGALKVSLNRREFYAYGGDVVFVNSETVHGALPENCVYECIVLNQSLLNTGDKLCGDFISGLVDQIIVVNDHFKHSDTTITLPFNKLFEVMEKNGSYFEAMGALYTAFGTVLRENRYKSAEEFRSNEFPQNTKLKNALAYMRKNYAEQLTLEQISAAAGMSSKYFCSFFKEITRTSPINYLNSYRVERAARKLLATDESVTEIALGCGFNNLSYFIKTFKQAKGVTPYKFRKNSGI